MKFAFNEEQEALRESARSFLQDHSTHEMVTKVMETEEGYDPAVWAQLGAELGWTAVHIPEDYGGLGLTYVELVALLEVMGEAVFCSPFFSSICLAANALLVGGTEEQKQAYLPKIAKGEKLPLHYRVLLHSGDPQEANVQRAYQAYVKSGKGPRIGVGRWRTRTSGTLYSARVVP